MSPGSQPEQVGHDQDRGTALLWGLAGVALVLALFSFCVSLVLPGVVERWLRAEGIEAEVQHVDIAPLPLRLVLHGVSGRNRDDRGFKVDHLALDFSWFGLLRRRLQLQHILLDGVHLDVARKAPGAINGTPSTSETPNTKGTIEVAGFTLPIPGEADDGDGGSAWGLRVDNLRALDTALCLHDLATGEAAQATECAQLSRLHLKQLAFHPGSDERGPALRVDDLSLASLVLREPGSGRRDLSLHNLSLSGLMLDDGAFDIDQFAFQRFAGCASPLLQQLASLPQTEHCLEIRALSLFGPLGMRWGDAADFHWQGAEVSGLALRLRSEYRPLLQLQQARFGKGKWAASSQVLDLYDVNLNGARWCPPRDLARWAEASGSACLGIATFGFDDYLRVRLRDNFALQLPDIHLRDLSLTNPDTPAKGVRLESVDLDSLDYVQARKRAVFGNLAIRGLQGCLPEAWALPDVACIELPALTFSGRSELKLGIAEADAAGEDSFGIATGALALERLVLRKKGAAELLAVQGLNWQGAIFLGPETPFSMRDGSLDKLDGCLPAGLIDDVSEPLCARASNLKIGGRLHVAVRELAVLDSEEDSGGDEEYAVLVQVDRLQADTAAFVSRDGGPGAQSIALTGLDGTGFALRHQWQGDSAPVQIEDNAIALEQLQLETLAGCLPVAWQQLLYDESPIPADWPLCGDAKDLVFAQPLAISYDEGFFLEAAAVEAEAFSLRDRDQLDMLDVAGLSVPGVHMDFTAPQGPYPVTLDGVTAQRLSGCLLPAWLPEDFASLGLPRCLALDGLDGGQSTALQISGDSSESVEASGSVTLRKVALGNTAQMPANIVAEELSFRGLAFDAQRIALEAGSATAMRICGVHFWLEPAERWIPDCFAWQSMSIDGPAELQYDGPFALQLSSGSVGGFTARATPNANVEYRVDQLSVAGLYMDETLLSFASASTAGVAGCAPKAGKGELAPCITLDVANLDAPHRFEYARTGEWDFYNTSLAGLEMREPTFPASTPGPLFAIGRLSLTRLEQDGAYVRADDMQVQGYAGCMAPGYDENVHHCLWMDEWFFSGETTDALTANMLVDFREFRVANLRVEDLLETRERIQVGSARLGAGSWDEQRQQLSTDDFSLSDVDSCLLFNGGRDKQVCVRAGTVAMQDAVHLDLSSDFSWVAGEVNIDTLEVVDKTAERVTLTVSDARMLGLSILPGHWTLQAGGARDLKLLQRQGHALLVAMHPWHFDVKEVELAGLDYQQEQNRLVLDSLRALGPNGMLQRELDGQLTIDEEIAGTRGMTYEQYMAERDRELERNPFTYRVGDVQIADGNFSWIDATEHYESRLPLSKINVAATGLDTAPESPPGKLLFGAQVGRYGDLQVAGNIAPHTGNVNADLTGYISTVNLIPANPYSVDLLGYTVQQGELDAKFNIHIVDNQLEAQSRVVLNKIKVRQVRDEESLAVPIPKTLIPLSWALWIMKDGQGNVSFNMPVSGDIEDPEFNPSFVFSILLQRAIMEGLFSYFTPVGFYTLARHAWRRIRTPSFDPYYFEPGSFAVQPGDRQLQEMIEVLHEHPDARPGICGISVGEDWRLLFPQTLEQTLAETDDEDAKLMPPRITRLMLQKLAADRSRAIQDVLVEGGIEPDEFIECRPEFLYRDEEPRVEFSY
ncbi:DUF748 domain-containing protein [Biformimicrobium ophioploci]|uniref:Uncharacterized protein n=1 Tax=Biformimicrobium ophioploci TaxID=3036711 RepID=A0ABQ6M0Y5_9GAMM|nr:DUF748 domain-containing protein [Microbulbifer sp. NKW57]GMG87983.1 hypothetical protein MNKW57_23040 [Microbulbifer sp. NKW57]